MRKAWLITIGIICILVIAHLIGIGCGMAYGEGNRLTDLSKVYNDMVVKRGNLAAQVNQLTAQINQLNIEIERQAGRIMERQEIEKEKVPETDEK